MSNVQRILEWLIYLPLGLAGLFGLLTLLGSWRRILALIVLTFATLIIAAQHNAFLTLLLRHMIGQSSFTAQSWSALTFGGSIIVVGVLLYLVFRVLWNPASSWRSPSFVSLLWGILGAGIGWLFGVALLPALFAVLPTLTYNAPYDLLSSFRMTLRFINVWLTPWVSGNLPLPGID